MNTWISYILIVLFIISLSYIFVKQIKHTLSLHKKRNLMIPKRLLIISYLTTFAIAGFLITFILNVLIYLQVFLSNVFTSNNTAIACFLFLIFFLFLKYRISPKKKTNVFLN